MSFNTLHDHSPDDPCTNCTAGGAHVQNLHDEVQAGCYTKGTMAKPTAQHRSRAAFSLLTAAVALLGIALIALGVWSWQQSRSDAMTAFQARLMDRALSINASLRRVQPADMKDHLEDQLAEYDEGGYAMLVSPSGEVQVATAGAPTGPQDTGWLPPRSRQRRHFHPQYREITADGADMMEIWIRARPSRRDRRRPRAAADNGPLLLVVAAPRSAGLIGATAATAQLILSVAVAVVLLIVALLALGQSRRATRLEVDLERRQRLATLGELAAVLAHEIRTPLAGLKGYAQLIQERAEGASPRIAGPAEKVLRESERLGRLVDDLLDYARPSQLNVAPCDLAQVAQEVAESLAPMAATRQVRLMVDATGEEPLDGDADRLHRAISNLMMNAIQLTPSGEQVLTRLSGDRGQIALQILDRGPGIPLEARAQIFEPFVTGRAKGTGLGLAIVRRIVDEHGGTIEVHDRPGGGAIFSIQLPRRGAATGGQEAS